MMLCLLWCLQLAPWGPSGLSAIRTPRPRLLRHWEDSLGTSIPRSPRIPRHNINMFAGYRPAVLLLSICLLGIQARSSLAVNVRYPPMGPYKLGSRGLSQRPPATELIEQCTERHRQTRLDHFSEAANNTSFSQRYFVCDRNWKEGGSIFFYLGNEADVLLYLNNTGLMWELAPKYDALLVFAEHRYYGESKPFAKGLRSHMQWLTTEQAMADYAMLIFELKRELKDPHVPVIGFGGSYGGMLATWFRMKYPHLMDGAVAGSAPIWTFMGEDPPADPGSFAKIVTRDAQPQGGSAPACAGNVRNAWDTMFKWGESKEGRERIGGAMRLCDDSSLTSKGDVAALADWSSSAWDYMAMGDYPYPSSYILNGDGELPAFPVRVACSHLATPGLEGEELLAGLAQAVGVFYNHSGDLDCLDFKQGANPETDEDADFWGYQYCTEQFMPFRKDGVRDMFWPQPFHVDGAVKACEEQWGVKPRPFWATIEWGGRRIEAASNIVFSNGLLDPWSGGGVLRNLSDSLVAVLIPEGAHHLDLMFSHPLDPPSVKHARAVEEHFIAKWIAEARSRGPHATEQLASLGRRGMEGAADADVA